MLVLLQQSPNLSAHLQPQLLQDIHTKASDLLKCKFDQIYTVILKTCNGSPQHKAYHTELPSVTSVLFYSLMCCSGILLNLHVCCPSYRDSSPAPNFLSFLTHASPAKFSSSIFSFQKLLIKYRFWLGSPPVCLPWY